jgi:hypothetical protein
MKERTARAARLTVGRSGVSVSEDAFGQRLGIQPDLFKCGQTLRPPPVELLDHLDEDGFAHATLAGQLNQSVFGWLAQR